MMKKYRVHEVAKDLDVQNKDVLDILTQYVDDTKKHMTALEENELDIVFETYTQKKSVESFKEFEQLLQSENTLLVVGFSYCHKPFECPSGRFTDQCQADPSNPVCRQCYIGKAVNALPEKECIPLFIPTIHYVAEKILDLIDKYPKKQLIFIITACEMTLEMFGDWGNMAAIRGLGVRLDGRICNTMKAFELSETGIKPGLTVVLDDTKQRVLDFIRLRRDS